MYRLHPLEALDGCLNRQEDFLLPCSPQCVMGEPDMLIALWYAETLGGNCLTTMIGTVRQGEWDRSLATLKHLVAAQQVSLKPPRKQTTVYLQQSSRLVSTCRDCCCQGSSQFPSLSAKTVY